MIINQIIANAAIYVPFRMTMLEDNMDWPTRFPLHVKKALFTATEQ